MPGNAQPAACSGAAAQPPLRIDAHQHYWHPGRADYPWMASAPACLQRAFGPHDLAPLLADCGLHASVLVQAAPTVDETRYLLDIAQTTPTVAGVVGWIDFADPGARRTLERLAAQPALVGLRPMVQDIADDDWVLRPQLAWAFAALQELGLAFDALGHPRHARRFLALCARYPDLRVVLDHGLKPAIARGQFSPWAADMRELARHTQAWCKLSGLASEAAPHATEAAMRPYAEHLLEVFGPGRLIWGSDWPVASAAIGYRAWQQCCAHWLAPLTQADQARVFGGNAQTFYRLRTGNRASVPFRK